MLQAFEKKFRDVINSFRTEEAAVKRELEQCHQAREDHHTLPLPQDDFIKLFTDLIDKGGQTFPHRLHVKWGHLVNQPMRSYDNWKDFNPMVLFSNLAADSGAIAYCFKDAIKQGTADAIREWDWPTEVGLPRAEREKAVAKLDKQIDKLQKQLAKIRGVASSEGVQLLGVSKGTKGDDLMLKKATKIAKPVK